MKILLPEKAVLQRTSDIDYFDWNYKFPISLVQKYRFKRIVKLLGNDKYEAILEVGTGSGVFIPELSRHTDVIYAMDIHNHLDAVKRVCEHYEIKHYNVSKQSIENTNFKDGFFDVVIAVSVLEFVNDLQAAIKEIKRILKKDGIFITICPMESKFLDLILSFYSSKDPKDEFGESRKYVTKSLEESFHVIEKGYMLPVIGRFFPVYTYYKLIK